ncbi:DUF5134 domain-containing protein [Actinopolyspora mortivallis]|uniref:DUF5134 domain-containing protein n=1 Tax=Actinopolyspora mortivallis TaxID=33906 RepID=UPI00036C9948|nr:DUF5134 domain-containing protein [Actinopolyspora mortivallis]
MEASMAMPLLPDWSRPLWALLLVVVLVQHALHARRMSGQPRWWHAGHTTMALGMAVMYLLPHMRHPDLYRVGLVLFALITVLELVVTVVLRSREGLVNPLWLSSTAGMLAMTYMMVPGSSRPAWLTLVFVGYLCCETVVWSLGWWERVPWLRPHGVTAPAPGAATTAPGRAVLRERGVGLPAHCSPGVRASLAVMAASMAYMLLAGLV